MMGAINNNRKSGSEYTLLNEGKNTRRKFHHFHHVNDEHSADFIICFLKVYVYAHVFAIPSIETSFISCASREFSDLHLPGM